MPRGNPNPKPSPATQFKPGTKPNPEGASGNAAMHWSFKRQFKAELAKAAEGGQTKFEAMIGAAVNEAIAGSVQHLKAISDYVDPIANEYKELTTDELVSRAFAIIEGIRAAGLQAAPTGRLVARTDDKPNDGERS